jgi:hypothetical protein|tara:strand:+ start:275 stop:502 length:228 start_codon:yes stop_codon:yes gene_type:complete
MIELLIAGVSAWLLVAVVSCSVLWWRLRDIRLIWAVEDRVIEIRMTIVDRLSPALRGAAQALDRFAIAHADTDDD